MEESENKIKVDFDLKDTELGWMERVDKCVIKIAPAWFSILGWVLILGAMHFLHKQSNSLILATIIGISWYLFIRYLIAVFYRIEIVTFPFVKSPSKIAFISSIISGGLAIVCWLSMSHVVNLLVDSSK